MGPSLESREQTRFFSEIIRLEALTKDWRYGLPYGIRNEGKRGKRDRGEAIAMGLKSGIPDIHVPIALCGYSSLYVEMKRPATSFNRAGKLSPNQSKMIELLERAGNLVAVCYGCDAALSVLDDYFNERLHKDALA